MTKASAIPQIIQGGMGVGVSNWRLARAVAMAGHLGVISGTGIDTVFVRRLQDGDIGGHLRRAMARFPMPQVAQEALRKYFRPDGRAPGEPYKELPMYRQGAKVEKEHFTMLATFVEVFLAKEGHDRPIGVNLLTKIQLPTLAGLYGAMLAGVDVVLMGAGIPKEVPGALDAFAAHQPASMRLEVEGRNPDDPVRMRLDPKDYWDGPPQELKRPLFFPIIASSSLATMLARKASGRVDGFIIEGPTAGGHNAPSRGDVRLNERGEPIYGHRDVVDLDKVKELGLPFWLAGGAGRPGRLQEALDVGAAGIQVGTLFAYLNYRSTSRRLVFVALSVVVPIGATWIRAYTIVRVGHLTGSPMILGVEHTTYGWFLFGFIVMIMFFVGARWAEPDEQPAPVPPPSPGEKGRSTPWGLSIAIVLLLLGTHAWAWRLDHGAALPAPTLTLPAGLDGWRADPQAAAIPWTPGYVNPSAQHSVSYVQGPRGVQLWVAYYRQQDRSRKLVSSINRVVDPADTRWAYLLTGSLRPAADLPEFRAGIVRKGAAPTLSETRRQRFWQLYWIGGRWTHNEAAAKIWQALDGLFGRGDDGAVLILSTDLSDDADPTLEKFARAHLGAIDAALSAVRDTR